MDNRGLTTGHGARAGRVAATHTAEPPALSGLAPGAGAGAGVLYDDFDDDLDELLAADNSAPSATAPAPAAAKAAAHDDFDDEDLLQYV